MIGVTECANGLTEGEKIDSGTDDGTFGSSQMKFSHGQSL